MGWIEKPGRYEGLTQILFIDDDPSWNEAIKSIFDSVDSDMNVTTVNSVEVAKDRLSDGDFDCVISDYKMPGMDGIELLEYIRQNYRNLPYILVTAKGNESLASEAIALGVDDYLTKDMMKQPEILLNRIENVVLRKQNRQARIESEERYRNIANTVADSICVYQNGDLVYANQQFCELIGRNLSELKQIETTEFIHKQDLELYNKYITDESVGSSEIRLIDDSDNIRYCVLDAKQVTIDEGPATACVFHDITDRRKREKQLEKYKLFIESTSDIILLLDSDGKVTYQSPVPDNDLYCKPRNLVGSSPSEYIHPDDIDKVKNSFEKLLENPDMTDRTIYRFRTKNGEWRWFENIAQNYLDDPDINGILVTVRDIHEQKQTEQKLKRELRLKEKIWNILVQNLSREEIAEQFCREIVNELVYDMSCIIVDENIDSTSINPYVIGSSNDEIEYPSSLFRLEKDKWEDDPVMQTFEKSRPVIIDQISDKATWGSMAKQYGFISVATIPIRHAGIDYGVLSVYTKKERITNNGQLAQLRDIADTVGYALSTLTIFESLMADMSKYVRLKFTDNKDALAVVGSHDILGSSDIKVNTVLRGSNADQWYGECSLPPKKLSQIFEGWERVYSYDIDIASSGETRFRVEVSHPSLSSTILQYNGVFESAELKDGFAEITLRLPPRTPTRKFIDACKQKLDNIKVTASGPTRNQSPSRPDLLDLLTERQREVLQIAYYRGYFEQPKKANSEDIASDLGIDRSTFTQHLRTAQRKLLGKIFKYNKSN